MSSCIRHCLDEPSCNYNGCMRKKSVPAASLTIRDIQTRLAEIAPEFTTLVGEFTTHGGRFESEVSTNRFQALMLEQQQLTAALAEKEKGAGERKAKKASKPKKAAVAEAVPAEIKG